MPHAAIVCIDDCYASCATGFADILQVANAHLRRQRGRASELFTWEFISMDGLPVRASNGLPLAATAPAPRKPYGLVFIPSLHYGGSRAFSSLLARQRDAQAWMVRQWEEGAWLVANCTGTFVLAGTGLLNGREATTTWWLERQFRARFPQVDLQLRPVVTEVDRLVCAGASASYLLQAVRVVERLAGQDIAAQCARSMLIDVSHTVQTPYLPLLVDKSHGDSLVHRAQHWLQNHMAEPGTISDLSARLAVSERTLARRFKAALEQTPLDYLQRLRIDAARALLEAGDMTVDSIASQVGYQDASSFTRLFRTSVGLSPAAYRARFK